MSSEDLASNAETLRDRTNPDKVESPEKVELQLDELSDRKETPQEEDDYPHGFKLALLTIALCLSVFLVALDNTIIATAIPKITDKFKSLDDVGWYGSAYLLTTAATQLLFGKFYTFLPVKWVFVAAITIFEVGSAICGAAPSSTALIVGRAIAGLGSAGIFSGAMIIVGFIGPLMGGAFTDKVSWRWCFYINLPIGAITLLVIIFLFKMPQQRNQPAGSESSSQPPTFTDRLNLFDPWGTLVFIPAIVCLLLALQWGGSKYPWKSGRIIALFVVFGVLISGFIGVQFLKQEKATIPPRVFKQRSIWSGAFYAFCIGSSFFILSFYLPIWFQAIHGASAVKSGIDNLPMILSLVVASILSGGLITAIGYYTPFMILSSIIAAVGAGLVSTLKTTSGAGKWIPYQIVCGLGVGLGMQQPMLAAQTALELKDVPTGTSIIIFAQTLGGALFISIGQNVFTNKLVEGLKAHVPGVNPELVLSAGATSLKQAVEAKFLQGVLFAYNDALVASFYVAIAMASLSLIGSLVIEWKSIKGKNIEMGMAA